MIQQDEHNNPYQGYANYEAPRRSYSADDLGYPERKSGLLRNPVLATGVLLLGASLLAAVILFATPKKSDDAVLPVIKADTSPMKVSPDHPGGMEIANRDSTVFEQIQNDPAVLPPQDTQAEQPVQQVEDLLAAAKSEINVKETTHTAAETEADKKAEAEVKTESDSASLSVASQASEPKTAPADTEIKTEPVPAPTPKEEPSEADTFTKPEKMHPAGSSPETLAFVRSVLNNEQLDLETETPASTSTSTSTSTPAPSAETAPAKAPEKVAPVQTSAPKPAATGLTHYVQLSSIRDEARASAEWASVQKRYSSVLSGATYRVQKKDLGAKGIYYRIQAGPFSKSDAAAKCEAIKAITPQGCYLVAQ